MNVVAATSSMVISSSSSWLKFMNGSCITWPWGKLLAHPAKIRCYVQGGGSTFFDDERQTSLRSSTSSTIRLEASWENSIIQVERHAPKNLFIILKKFKNSKELEFLLIQLILTYNFRTFLGFCGFN